MRSSAHPEDSVTALERRQYWLELRFERQGTVFWGDTLGDCIPDRGSSTIRSSACSGSMGAFVLWSCNGRRNGADGCGMVEMDTEDQPLVSSEIGFDSTSNGNKKITHFMSWKIPVYLLNSKKE